MIKISRSFKINKRAQNLVEYALIIGIVVAAFIGMQHVIKRSIQGKLFDISEDLGPQFEPGRTTASSESWQQVFSNETTDHSGSNVTTAINLIRTSEQQVEGLF